MTETGWQKYECRGYSGPPCSLPRKIPTHPKRVLVHNHVQHTKDMWHGANGFRCWTQLVSPDIMKCKCGWSGLPHYSVRAFGKQKCVG